MKPISVVISSLRPDRLEVTLDNIASERDLVEVVVASPTPPKSRDFVKHVPVPASGDPAELTFTQKYNLAVKHSSGTYIIYNNDDIHFTPGWAAPLIKHMEARPCRPYLAAFQIATNGLLIARHTIFGLLYGNHGCIRREDLDTIGGLLDERLYMYYSEVDLALRVWSAGGRVAMCPEVTVHADRDVDQMAIPGESVYLKRAGKTKKPPTYKDIWLGHDCRVFVDLWFPQYIGLFWRHYDRLRDRFTNTDGVLPASMYEAGLLKVMLWPAAKVFLSPRRWFAQKHKVDFIKTHFARVANRRWGQLSYELPYRPEDVIRRLPTHPA